MAGLFKSMTGWLRGSRRAAAAPPRVIFVAPEPRPPAARAEPAPPPIPAVSFHPEPAKASRAMKEPAVSSEPAVPGEPRVRAEPFVPELSA